MTSCVSAVESIQQSLNEICLEDDHHYYWENHRKFSVFAKRLEHVMSLLLRLFSPETLPLSVQTSIKGIAADLRKAEETLSVYANKGKVFVLINCQSLCESLHDRTVAIGGWLALLQSGLEDVPDLHKKISDLSLDMMQAQFRVTENEERVHCTLEKEGEGRRSSKVIQSAIVMDLARALGIESNNHIELSNQIKLLRDDLSVSGSLSERRILTSLEGILDYWSIKPDIFLTQIPDFDFDDNSQISPFSSFLCPLTKQVMKDPVVLESSQNYDRISIQYWFDRCSEDGRDPTCPVSGQVLNSVELKPNIGLAGAIDEWVNRNVEIHLKLAVKYLSEDSLSIESIEHVLDNLQKISEDHMFRYKVRNAGIVNLVIDVLRNNSKKIGSRLRSKALMVLLNMANDVESKNMMIEEGVIRLAVHSLIGSSEKEREYSVKLLLEFSKDEDLCVVIASQKGALVLLSSMAGNLERPALSNLAEEVLKRMENVDENVQQLAVAGRFEPLLSRLCEGTDNVQIDMANMLGKMTLTSSSKEQIARRSAKILIQLLSNPEGRIPCLQALHNLSSLDDNATILVDSAALPSLLDILFKDSDDMSESKELSASIIANIVSNPGHWELDSGYDENNSLQSKSVVLNLLNILSVSSSRCQVAILRILYGTASSPQASESITAHIKSGNGLRTIILFLDHQEIENRICAFKLIKLLSGKLPDALADELRAYNKLNLIKQRISDNQSMDCKRSDAACILANIPLTETEVKTLLDDKFIKWAILTLKSQNHNSTIIEGLLGVLIHVARSTDAVNEDYPLLKIFREHLFVSNSKPRYRQLAAIGLQHLAQSRPLTSPCRPPTARRFCFFSSSCFKPGRNPVKDTCPIHNLDCTAKSQFCLIKGDCVKPLLDLLSDNDASVRVAAVEALTTLVSDCSDIVVDELERIGVVEGVIKLFIGSRPGEIQEKSILMVERILRAENLVLKHSLNQPLLRALVDAFKHGNSLTKRCAQEALTSLKQISGVSGKTSSQNRGKG